MKTENNTSKLLKELNYNSSTPGLFDKFYNKVTEELIGQDDIKEKIKPKVFTSITSMRLKIKERPTVFFFVWQSRSWKTLLARKIWEIVWWDYCFIPMANFTDETNLRSLLWAELWLVWCEKKAILEDYAFNNKTWRYTIIFDEIEKMSKKIEPFFLEILDTWFVTLLSWRILDLRNSIIIFTSNLGMEDENWIRQKKVNKDLILNAIQRFFRPEIFNRMWWKDGVYIFSKLGKKDFEKIIDFKIRKQIETLNAIIKSKKTIDVDELFEKIKWRIKDVNHENITTLVEEVQHQIILEFFRAGIF